MKLLSTIRGFVDNNRNQQEIFHKNLFLDNFNHFRDDSSDEENDEDNEEESYDTKNQNFYKFKNNSRVYKLKHLPVPLTDTIAEVLQEFSHEKFLVDDISFIFEMSRKRAVSPYALVIALIYLNRLQSKVNTASYNTSAFISSKASGFDKYSVNYLTNTELCLISLILASKYLIDEGETEEIYNDEWASASDLPVKEINKLEKSFLRQIDWDLYVSSQEFWAFTHQLTEKTTRKKIKLQQNQCTYSDLDVLLSNPQVLSIDTAKKYLDFLTKVFIVCSSTIVYVAVSSFLVSACIGHIKNQILNHTTSLPSKNVKDSSENVTYSTSLINHREPVDIKSLVKSDPAINHLDGDFQMEHNETRIAPFRKHYECDLALDNVRMKLNEGKRFQLTASDRKRKNHLGYVRFKGDHILSKFLF